MFFSLVKLVGNLLEKASHVLLPVQHVAGLFVAFNVVLNFLLKVFVDSFVLKNAEEAFIDFTVENLVLICQFKMLLPQILTLEAGLVKFTFTGSH